MPRELHPVYSSLNGFHAANEQQINLTVPDLANLVLAHTHKDKEYYISLLSNLDELDVAEETTSVLINSILDNKKLKEISLAAYDVTEGRMSRDKIVSLFQDFLEKQDEGDEEEPDFLVNDIEAVVNKVVLSSGLTWRLNTMNKMLGSLRKGNFGFIFARPETGKTTFLASEVTYMAEQLPDDSGPILWLNNEQEGSEVLLRLYQASLGWDLAKILSDLPGAQKQYIKNTKDKLKLVDRSILHKNYVESLCKKYKPSLVVVDQMDAVEGFKDDRKDLELGQKYKWGRILAKQYCPFIAVCQADGSGEGVKWLTMNNVADAKTAKQAHPDWILGIGKVNDPGYDALRYLHLSKNKLHGDAGITDPELKHGRMEVLIEQHVGRYKDLF